MNKLFIAIAFVAVANSMLSCGEKNEPADPSIEQPDEQLSQNTKPDKDGAVQTEGLVDLGLSVKWAACNLDANTENHFATSCTESGSSFRFSAIKVPGFLPETIGGTTFDNATNLLGEGWHTPTKDQVEELVKKCRTNYAVFGNTVGMIITGPNNKAMFLPQGYVYWTCNSSSKTSMYCFYFDPQNHELTLSQEDYSRLYSVRPVYE